MDLLREKLYPGEDKYFRENPKVAGMAAEDGFVILNPYSELSDQEKSAVYRNEAARLLMREKGTPEVSLTRDQQAYLEGTTYKSASDEDRRATILARIVSGDPSAGIPTMEQQEAAKGLLSYGKRNDGTEKGKGYLGELKRPDGGVSTEISVGVDFGAGEMEIPLLVPTLSKEEVSYLLSVDPKTAEIPKSIMDKAVQHAIGRLKAGSSPFAD